MRITCLLLTLFITTSLAAQSYVDKTGDLMTGILTIHKSGMGLRLKSLSNGVGANSFLAFYGNDDARDGYIGYGSNINNVLYVLNDTNSDIRFITGNTQVKVTNSTFGLDVNTAGRFQKNLTLGSGSSQSIQLTLDATDIAGAPAMTNTIRMNGYEGRGKGILYTDITTGGEWFSGVPYNAGHNSYQIGFSQTGDAEYTSNAVFNVKDDGRVDITKGQLYVGSVSQQASSLVIQANNTAGSPSMTNTIEMDGYEGRGKGILYSDVTVGGEWFSGVPYNAGHDSYQIGFGQTGDAEWTNNAVFRITDQGNAVISGKLETQKIRVSTSPSLVPDYVFQPSYQLRSLSELEAFVNTNAHLPNIPSAREMAADGQDLGDLQLKLLEKIEELTLYTIDQEKQLKEKDTKIEKLEETLNALIQRIEKLESGSQKD